MLQWGCNKRFIPIVIAFVMFIYIINIYIVDDSSIHSPADLAVTYNNSYDRGILDNFGRLHIVFNDDIADSSNAWVRDNEYVDFGARPPYRFRILGNQIAYHTRHIFAEADGVGFYRSYIFWSFLFVAMAMVFMYKSILLVVPDKIAFSSIMMSMLSPSIMFMFKYPILVTVNDHLALLVVAAGLYAVLKEQYVIAVLVTVIGAFSRETVMVIMLFQLVYSKRSIIYRIVISIIPLFIWLAFRYLWGIGNDMLGYDPLDGLRGNLRYLPITVCYFFTVYGFVWSPLILGFLSAFKNGCAGELHRIVRCSLAVFAVTVAFHMTFARIEETRITAMTFAPFAVFVIASFLETLGRPFKVARYWIVYAAGVGACGLALYAYVCLPATAQDYLAMAARFKVFLVGMPLYFFAQYPQLADIMTIQGWVGIAVFHVVCLGILTPVCVLMSRETGLGVRAPAPEKPFCRSAEAGRADGRIR